jgi:DEAD/DEAH box helicase domain-containing protein
MADADPLPTSNEMPSPLTTLERVRSRVGEAVLSQARVRHPGLRAELARRFAATGVADGALLREPVIEGAAPYRTSGRTLADCSGKLLDRAVIDAVTRTPFAEYRFPVDLQPYEHQIAAWEHLTATKPQSVLVSSGTGSGKTECFLLPLLDDLARESGGSKRLSGVRALALYPLNALIASQEERLRAWTSPFGGRIRFGLYNGLMPDNAPRLAKPALEQVIDRKTLRADPPPLLVTNATMLEYMLVRRVDRPIIEASQGKLRWIILDEAHSYIGSSAAEIALLLRRVLLTFGVTPDNVRFVATSATIGDGQDVTDELRRYLRDLSGADEGRVHVIIGHREKVVLPTAASELPLPATSLVDRDALAANPVVQKLVRTVETGAVEASAAATMLKATGQPLDKVLTALATDLDHQRGPLLPLRVHGFLRAVPGVWSCLNPDCPESPADWPFGGIADERIDTCPACQSLILEVLGCSDCGETWLDAEDRGDRIGPGTTPPTEDEFAVLSERESPEALEDTPDTGESAAEYDAKRIVIATLPLKGTRPFHVDPQTGAMNSQVGEGLLTISVATPDGCRACEAADSRGRVVLRPLRFGAPFLIGNAAPVLLEGTPASLPPAAADMTRHRPPAEGRQLLSFTDSRQGTARFAANLQTNAERGFVRGHIYHAVQGSMAASGDTAAASKLRAEIAQLEPHAALAELVGSKRMELAALEARNIGGIRWPVLRDRLAATPEVGFWMTNLWGDRDPRYKSADALAQYLLLREFARRPRRGNSVETLGLARLRFDAIENVRTVPSALLQRGKTLADWQGLLYSMIDMVLRANFATRLHADDAHWLHLSGAVKTIMPPGEKPQAKSEQGWPFAGTPKGLPSNLVLILAKALKLDRFEGGDRALINDVLSAAWTALVPLLRDSTRIGDALDFDLARIAPLTEGFACSVSGRVLPETVLGYSPYGHRDGLATAARPCAAITIPALPQPFPRDASGVEEIRQWLASDPLLAALRESGLWRDVNDRAALFSPYLRAAEHSAQQPPWRLRAFENQFKAGQINILNCSTTMEMGVDIGSVTAVMMTNAPPSLANYRQRVGRAGRRKQGFAMALTYTRDTPLDREAFRNPLVYLARTTRAPRVKLDSRPIVQRHVNALLLARWFASAGGEALKARVGAFFGTPEGVGAALIDGSPIDDCLAWIEAPSTHALLLDEVTALTRNTVLADDRTLFAEAAQALRHARDAVVIEWQALQTQALEAPPEAQRALSLQLRRLTGEALLGELGNRSVLPSHGFPTGVVPFVNDMKSRQADSATDSTPREGPRRSYPTRTIDIAIRDYAPGAEVVIDGLVYRSAGITLNWQRPADAADVHEIQSLKTFWSCGACGAGDCAVVVPAKCPTCRAAIERQRRFIEPAGFTADWQDRVHAETDQVNFIVPEPEQIVARGAPWQSFADPAQGRMRASPEGLVFASSQGPGKAGYEVCLDCGRAGPAGHNALVDHFPLRPRKGAAGMRCPGNDKPFTISRALALGAATTTDVAELQPAQLGDAGTAWAVISALREALARTLGVEPRELGMAIKPARTDIGQTTHSLFLFDRAPGGAGYAGQAVTLYEALLKDARRILDCPQAGCVRGCASCVLAPDLYAQAELLDRQAALDWVAGACAALSGPADADRIGADATLRRSVADDLVEAVRAGARNVRLWINGEADLAMLSRGGLIGDTLRRLDERGAEISLVCDAAWLAERDAAQRLAIRDESMAVPFKLLQGTVPDLPNGHRAIAAADNGSLWASRDLAAVTFGDGWGSGGIAPVVRIAVPALPIAEPINVDSLLPISGTNYVQIERELDGRLSDFGDAFVRLLSSGIAAAGGSGALVRIDYSDRYLQSPLVVRLLAEVLGALARAYPRSSGPVSAFVATNVLNANPRQPFAPDHDWCWPEDRGEVLQTLLTAKGFEVDLSERGASHGRMIVLTFSSGARVRVVLDQGFGPWRTPHYARFDFGDAATNQARKLAKFDAILAARGATYAVVTGG